MRKRPKPLPPEKQAQLTAAEQKRAEKEFGKQLRAWERERASYQRQIDRQYEKQLKTLESLGAYEPKGHELTAYRKKRIRQATRELNEFIEGDYAFVPLPDKKAIADARTLKMKTTRKGAFVAREGHKRVRLTRKKGELYIDKSGKTKVGVSGHERRYVVERIPLKALDELTGQQDRLRREAAALGPLKDRQQLAFILTENGQEGFSKRVFSDIDDLIEWVGKYEKAIPWKVLDIFRHVSIVKTESGPQWFREHPIKGTRIKKRKVNVKGRNV